MIKAAIMYDFDQTLATTNMQEYSLLPALGIDPSAFWSEVTELSQSNNMDPILAYMLLIVKRAKQQGVKLSRDFLKSLGKDIVYYPGVEDYFPRINEYAQNLGIELQHYIISSGTGEILEGTSIYDQFKMVYACEYHYDEDGNADWPAVSINYTGKTQFLFRIQKQCLDVFENEKINRFSTPREVPFTRMIYIADGLTDVPCMRLVKGYGGFSIAVNNGNQDTCDKLIEDKRVDFVAKADYSADSELDKILRSILSKIAIDNQLDELKK